MWLKSAKILLIFRIFLLLAGCTDATEPDRLGYVVAIGIDVPKEAEKGYDITLQFANASKISGGSSEEGGSGGNESIENITVTAPSIYSAVNIANHIISKGFVLSHTKLIVFSREVCQNGIAEFLETVGRSRDIRPNTYFAMSSCRAQEFLEAVNPETEVNPVRYYSMIFENDYSGFIPQNMASDFYFYYMSDEKNTVMPLCSVSEEKGTQNYGSGYQEGLPDYQAGEIPSGKAKTQVMGMAVFEGDKALYEIGDIETELYNLLVGEYKKSYVAYSYSRLPGGTITMRQEQKKRPKITIDTSSDTPKISVELFLEADFSSSVPQQSIEDNLDVFTEEATAEIKAAAETFLKATSKQGTDIIGFGSYAKRNFRDIKSFSDYNWKQKYKSAEFNVLVDFSVKRTGLIVRSERK